jgi:hypothetical protein
MHLNRPLLLLRICPCFILVRLVMPMKYHLLLVLLLLLSP